MIRDHSRAAFSVSVQCLTCGAMGLLANMLIDPDGPAFRAYYHDRLSCMPAPPPGVDPREVDRVRVAARCSNPECRLPECRR